MWKMIAICFCSAVCSYGVSFWLPTLVQQLNVRRRHGIAGLYTAASVQRCLRRDVSDRPKLGSDARERRWHLVGPFTCVSVGLLGSVWFHDSMGLALFSLTIAAIGAYSTTSMLFTIPGLFLSGVGMAAGVAMINCFGGLGGFVSPLCGRRGQGPDWKYEQRCNFHLLRRHRGRSADAHAAEKSSLIAEHLF